MTSGPGPVPSPQSRIVIDVPRLWAGGLATAVVAALVAWVSVLVATDVLRLQLSRPALLLPVAQSFAGNYAFTAAVLALAATGMAHLLSLTTPRPRVFFGWIVALVTVATMAIPFGRDGDLASKLGTATVNLLLGICIGTLLSTVLSRTVVDAERSWQEP